MFFYKNVQQNLHELSVSEQGMYELTDWKICKDFKNPSFSDLTLDEVSW